MLQSRIFMPTLREDPSDAEAISHKLLMRAGYVRQLAAGLYIFLPLGLRVLNKVNTILRQEMQHIGAQEISMTALHPSEPWKQTGRWETIGDEMFRLKDRTGRDYCLGMTHEEIMTWLAAGHIRSYRDLPQVWFQIQTKLRDEARPKSGILRTREFLMKDSYSFDLDDEGLAKNYQLHTDAYHRIFKRCGLKYYFVKSDPGMMGGDVAHEFMAPSPAGEDMVALCDECGYSANVELAQSVPKPTELQDWTPIEEVHTPERRTLDEVSRFFKEEKSLFIKSLAVITDDGMVLALVRGDQMLHELKLQRALGQEFRHAAKDEIKETLGVEAGFIGPKGQKVRIIADPVLKQGLYIAGANKQHYHLKGISAEDFNTAEFHDIHEASAGDACIDCGALLRTETCIEIGNIFKLGTKYSEPLEARYLDEDDNSHAIIMGSYGIGPARIMAAAVEQGNDKDGIIWPASIAPFDLHIIPVNMGHEQSVEIAQSLYASLRDAGFEVLMDDRDLRAGVKFKDADLCGIPRHIVIGERGLKEGVVEIKNRATGEAVKVKPEDVLGALDK